jgi:dephospho-CoA kinase
MAGGDKMSSRIFGLTGGIACGKSVVSGVFAAQGVPMVDADVIARDIVAPGTPALALLVSNFGREILLSDGSLDRPLLGSIVFTDPKKRSILDHTLRRYLQDEIRYRLKAASESNPLVGFEAPLLIERGYQNEYRPLLVVAVSPGIQLQRLMKRDGFTEDEAKARVSSQLPIEEKVQVADYVLWNNGTRDDLIKEALHVLSKIKFS